MWADRIVLPAPALDDDLSFPQRVEDLAVEQFVSQTGVEALDITVLPWASRRDVSSFGADCGDPRLHGLGNELGPII